MLTGGASQVEGWNRAGGGPQAEGLNRAAQAEGGGRGANG